MRPLNPGTLFTVAENSHFYCLTNQSRLKIGSAPEVWFQPGAPLLISALWDPYQRLWPT